MKCPYDQSEMEKGIANLDVSGSLQWRSKGSLIGKLESVGRNVVTKINLANAIWAYRCPKCGKVDFTTEG